jgi:site-specific recombinase XerD
MATTAIDKGMPIEQVQRLLGHEKIDTTLHYYGKQVFMESKIPRRLKNNRLQ